MDKLELYKKALSLRNKLGEDPSSPVDIFSLVYSIPNLTVVFYPMGDNISGMCIKNPKSPVIALNSSMSYGRQRFSLAHELYHLYYDNNTTSICSTKFGINREVEKEADIFASYFLIPPQALDLEIKKNNEEKNKLGIEEIVRLEQHFGVSRQVILNRLIDEKFITNQDADKYRQGVIQSAVKLGFDDGLYRPLPEDKQFKTYGYYIQLADKLFTDGKISTGMYNQLLLSAFRTDLVYGSIIEEGELND